MRCERAAYSSTDAVWFYDEDRCVLFHNDQVVGKAEDVDEATISTPVGAFVMTRRPGCAPAGYPNDDRLLPQIYTSQGNFRTR